MTEAISDINEGKKDWKHGSSAENSGVFFSSVEAAALTCFQSLLGGMDWADVFHVLEELGLFACLLFLSFIVFFHFALFNMITSLFVQKALKRSAIENKEILGAEAHKKLLQQLQDL